MDFDRPSPKSRQTARHFRQFLSLVLTEVEVKFCIPGYYILGGTTTTTRHA